jgi:hypothetical protein
MTFERIDEMTPYDILNIKFAMINVMLRSARQGRRSLMDWLSHREE